jgi:phospholipase C
MRTTIASTLILIAMCLGIFAAAPGNLHTFALSNGTKSRKAVHSDGAVSTLGDPRSPIRHLIVVVGENRSFDNVFGTMFHLILS